MKFSQVLLRSLLRNSLPLGLSLVVVLAGCVPPVLTAAFTSAPSESDPLTIEFTDASTQGNTPITDWSWNFGDGSAGAGPNPSHTYAQEGDYEVILTVSADTETSVVTQTVAVSAMVPDEGGGEGGGEGSGDGGGEGPGDGSGEGAAEGGGEGAPEGGGEGSGEGEGEFVGEPDVLTTLLTSSPLPGEEDVSVTRETILRFSGPLRSGSIDSAAIRAEFAGSTLPARIQVSPDETTVTLFYTTPLPASSKIQIIIDGDELRDEQGARVDGDRDGLSGGIAVLEFNTVSLTVSESTSVFGRVFASELAGTKQAPVNTPLQGVLISVDGAETEIFAETDEMGNFTLDPAPVGRFFVHIDGEFATNVDTPPEAYYPFVGRAFDAVAGQANDIGDIFLPLIVEGTLQTVSTTEDTVIEFPQSVLDANPELEGVSITIPANALFGDSGGRGGQVGIAPVDPERLPGALPDGLEFPLVITVQTNGPQNFDQPVPIRWPNLPDPALGVPLEPGETSSIFSFNHDSGKWEAVGTATVSDDGQFILSDPGSGLLFPGWHALGRNFFGPPPPPPDCPDGFRGSQGLPSFSKCLKDATDDTRWCLTALLLTAGLGGAIACVTAISVAIAGTAGLALPLALAGCIAADVAMGVGMESCRRGFVKGVNACQVCRNLSSTDKDELFAKIVQEELEAVLDDTGRELLSISEEMWEVLSPFVLEGQGNPDVEFPQQVFDQIDALQATADTLVGGDVLEFLEQQSLESEEAVLSLIEDPFNTAPVEPVLFAATVSQPGGGLTIRGRTEGFGQYRLFLPRDATLDNVLFYDPATKELGMAFPLISPNAQYALPQVFMFPSAVAGQDFGDAETFPDLPVGDAVDSDNDDLVDFAEFVVGTDPLNPDTDGDGITDGAEMEQGSDPLGGLIAQTGVIATGNTPGAAVDISASAKTVVVADSGEGIAVFNVFNGMTPVPVAQVDTPGTAEAVAVSGTFVAVADGASGLAVIDISDPTQSRIVESVRGAELRGDARAVATRGVTAFVGTDTGWVSEVNMEGGLIFGQVNLAADNEDLAVADLFVEGGVLYVLLTDVPEPHSFVTVGTLHVIPLNGGPLDSVGSVSTTGLTGVGAAQSNLRWRLFVGAGIAYVTHSQGYNTIDVSDPLDPTPITETTTQQFGWKQVIVNGSGHGLAAVGPNSQFGLREPGHHVSLYDVSDPLVTEEFVTEFETPGDALAVTIANGLAYVADHRNGMQVVNYIAFDSLGQPPVPNFTVNGGAAEAERGTKLFVVATVTDDVQVRRVDLLLNGDIVASDGNFPFELVVDVPDGNVGETFTLAVRASDTGGNKATSPEQTLTLADSTTPELVASQPRANLIQFDVSEIRLGFNEALDAEAVAAGTATLTEVGADGVLGGGDDTEITFTSLAVENDSELVLIPSGELPLPPGVYQLTVLAGTISDLLGNANSNDLTLSFLAESLPPEATIAWIGPGDGDLGDAGNWNTGALPGSEDTVYISVPGTTATLTNSRPMTVANLQMEEHLELDNVFGEFGPLLSVTGEGVLNGGLTTRSEVGSYPRAVIILARGAGASITVNGAMDIANTTFTANDGATMNLPSLESMVDSGLNVEDGGSIFANALASMDNGILSVSDAGSTLNVPVLVNMENTAVTVFDEGLLSVPMVTSVTLPEDTVDNSDHRPDFRVFSGGTLIFDSLTSISHHDIEVSAGGTLSLPALSTMTQSVVSLLDGDSLLSVDLLSDTTGTQFGLGSPYGADGIGSLDLPSVVTAVDTTFNILADNAITANGMTTFSGNISLTGATATLTVPVLSNVNNTAYSIRSGATLELPLVTTISTLDLEDHFRFTFSVQDGNSVLSLPNLETMNVQILGNYFDFTAANGGRLELPSLVSLTVADQNSFELVAVSDGLIDVSSLTTVSGAVSFSTQLGGVILADSLTSVTGGFFRFSEETQGLSLGGLSDIGTADLNVSNGAVVSLPLLTTISGRIDVSGNGSLTLDNVITAPGAVINVSSGGNSPSILSMASLTSLTNGTIFVGFPEDNMVDLPLLANIDGTTINVQGGPTLELPSVTSVVGGELQVSSATLTLNNLTEFTAGEITVNGPGAALDVPLLSNIDDTVLNVSNIGGTIGFPAVTSYTISSDEISNRFLSVSTEGTVLDLSNLQTLTIQRSTGAPEILANNGILDLSGLTLLIIGDSNDLLVEARTGGSIDMSALTEIASSGGAIEFEVSFYDAFIVLTALTTFDEILVTFTDTTGGSGGIMLPEAK